MSFPKYTPVVPGHSAPHPRPSQIHLTPETWRGQAEQLGTRAWLRQEHLLQCNEPNRQGFIEDLEEKLVQEGKLDRTFNISFTVWQ
uniref:NADH dehydrogenase [ubiquinone] 1 beta subcomplex subunit 4 n=1 Tax=Prolemur simus TaxID=1328070 RepID=A0A8C8YLZ7_PROSS